MFADPTSLNVNAVNYPLPRVFNPVAGGVSRFQNADESFTLEISHQVIKGKRERGLLKIIQKKITADPFIPANNVENYASAHVVLDNPKQGFTDEELGYLLEALGDYIKNDTYQAKFVGGEA